MAQAAVLTPETAARPMLELPREAWCFTALQRRVDTLRCTELCTTIGCLEAALPVVSGPQYVFHNGALAANLSGSAVLAHGVSHHEGVLADTCAAALDKLDVLSANEGGVHRLKVSGKVVLPLHLIHVASGEPSTSRFVIEVDAGAEVTLIEHQVAAPHFTTWQNLGCEIRVGKGAKVTHTVMQTMPGTCLLTRRTRVNVADGATYHASTFQRGGAFGRTETHAVLGENCDFAHIGLSLSRREQQHDTVLHVRHTGVNNRSNIRQRNLIDDAAHAVFQGKFHVDQPAQKTDAYMHCHNLLLNDAARASHKPELEIYADDVKCSHGAATGGLNASQLFYLKARGFTPKEAHALLTVGFAQEFFAEFPDVMHANLQRGLDEWLNDFMDTRDPTPDFGMGPIRRTGLEIAPIITHEDN